MSKPDIRRETWGTDSSGQAVSLYTLTNSAGTEAKITDFGGRIVSLKTADRNGSFTDVVLGFDNLDGYLKKNPFFGALVGRYANRIANGRFELNGHTYELARNNGPNALHGGSRGFDKVVWESQIVDTGNGLALELEYLSKDGEEGYPGTLKAWVTYSLNENNELGIQYRASTDKDTVLNLTNHSYFDLTGQFAGNILDHHVTIHADRFTPVDSNLIPTGELRDVSGTPFDLRHGERIGAHIDEDYEQLKLGWGYDHNFVLNGHGLRLAASVVDPATGRKLEVLTTQPGVQFYTGNRLDGSVTGKGGVTYKFRFGFCLETQHFPDSPNKPDFPSTVLKPGDQFHETTIFRFTTEA
ncbi:MAG: aldose epimerase family protein [Bryobacteraceae bacterium]